jgi:hypothetical protein
LKFTGPRIAPAIRGVRQPARGWLPIIRINGVATISEIAGRFPLDRAADAYRALESGAHGKVLVIPNLQSLPQDSTAPKLA